MIYHKAVQRWCRQSGITCLLLSLVYCINYVIAPLLVGGKRLQAALRPRVYSTPRAATWMKEANGELQQYAEANALLRFGYLQELGRTELLSLVGAAGVLTTDGHRGLWLCDLVTQGAAPVRSWLFPGRFDNRGIWVFRIEFMGEQIADARITVRNDLD